MTTAKYFRGIGPLWNINKLRKELEAALGQAVTCNVSDDGTTLEIEYTVPGAANVIDQVVAAHIAEVGYTIKAGNTNALFTNYGNFFYGTGSIEDGDASGIWGGYPPIEYPAGSGIFWTLIQLKNGVVTWASNSDTGAQTAGAGDIQFSNLGAIWASGVLPIYQAIYANGGNATARIGGIGGLNGTVNPVAGVWSDIEDSAIDVNNFTNGTFETGDFTGWTTASAGTGSVTINTANAKYGKYCAKVDCGDTTASLTSVRVTGNLSGILTWRAAAINHNSQIAIKWYDNTSGGSLLRTDTQQINQSPDSTYRWSSYMHVLDKPTGALSFEIVCDPGVATTITLLDEFVYTSHTTPPGLQGIFIRPGLEGPRYSRQLTESVLHYGSYAGYSLVVSASTTPTTAYTRTINANSLGPNGAFEASGRLRVRTAGATSVGVTLDFIFGATTLFTYASTATGATNDRTIPIDFDFVLTNQNDAAIQVASVTIRDKIANAGGSATVAADAFSGSGENRATEGTTADKAFTIRATLTTATNSRFEREYVKMTGPLFVS